MAGPITKSEAQAIIDGPLRVNHPSHASVPRLAQRLNRSEERVEFLKAVAIATAAGYRFSTRFSDKLVNQVAGRKVRC